MVEWDVYQGRGRYWVDVARAYHQWGKPERCYRALLAAERTARDSTPGCADGART
jgi:hypothetical protein